MEISITGETVTLDDVLPMEVDTIISWTSETNDNARQSVTVYKFNRENYESVTIVANFKQITEAAQPMQML